MEYNGGAKPQAEEGKTMEANEIRDKSFEIGTREQIQVTQVEILQELAAQVAEVKFALTSMSMACERIANQMEIRGTIVEREGRGMAAVR